MSDLVAEMFGDREEFYPGSKRKRRPEPVQEATGEVWRENYTVKMIGGQERRFFPIGALAAALGVSVDTVRHWVKTSKMPNAPYRLSTSIVHGQKYAGRRLYTEPMIDAAIAAFSKRGLLDVARIEWKNHHDLTVELHEVWSRIHQEETQ